MKRTPLNRKTGLTRSGAPLRRTRLKPRSAKTISIYVDRRALVASLLEERPWCEVRWDDGCQGRAVDVDEILSRGRGGSILDPANLQTTCRHCHNRKHAEPNEAVDRGVALRTPHGRHRSAGEADA